MARPKTYILRGKAFGEFDGIKLYYFGFKDRPRFLPESGRGFSGLKHILEILKSKFRRFTLSFTPDEDSVTKVRSLYKVRLSANSHKRFSQRIWDANRQLKLRMGRQLLSEALPDYFSISDSVLFYQRGLFSEILTNDFDIRRLSPEDSVALTNLFARSALQKDHSVLDIPTAYKTTRDAQLIYLKRLVDDFDREIRNGHEEAWWQKYFHSNILFFQNNYIHRLDKLNISVPGTQFPDFSVITADGYLDIIEIKKPSTDLLKEDTSRHNFYWSTEISKAISQVENYIDNVERHCDSIKVNLKDEHGLDIRIIRPRGIVVAGCSSQLLGNRKKSDDFQRLNRGLKHIQIIQYDELSQNLKNTIMSIERLAQASSQEKQGKKKKLSHNRH